MNAGRLEDVAAVAALAVQAGIDHLFPVLVGVAVDCGYELDF